MLISAKNLDHTDMVFLVEIAPYFAKKHRAGYINTVHVHALAQSMTTASSDMALAARNRQFLVSHGSGFSAIKKKMVLKDRAHLSTFKIFIFEKYSCFIDLVVFLVIVQSPELISVWFCEKNDIFSSFF